MKSKRDILNKKLKMYDVGEKMDKSMLMPSSSKSNKKYYPKLYLHDTELPFLNEDMVGKKVSLTVDAVLNSYTTSKRNGQDKKEGADIEIKSMGLK